MGYFGRLHIAPVGVFGEENSAPQYVRNPGIYAIGVEEAIAAQMPKPTTGVAKSVKPPWLSRRAHLRLRPGSSASPAPDSRSRAAVMLSMNFHRSVLSFLSPKKVLVQISVQTSRLYSLETVLSAYLSMQYTNRSRSPVRSLSLAALVLHCSSHGFHFLLYRSRLASLLPKLRYRVSGARASDHTITPLL